MIAGERQVSPDVEGIRRDHVQRYRFATNLLAPHSKVIDVACGVGYGAKIMADEGHTVLALDNDYDALAYGRQHYAHRNITRWRTDASAANFGTGRFDTAVCFETIEHIEDPLPLLKALREAAPRLIASVPNEEVFPFNNHAFHFRHYTPAEFQQLLAHAGWKVTAWFGQADAQSDVEPNVAGRTIVVTAEHADVAEQSPERFTRPAPVIAVVPEHVAILGLGPSLHAYMDLGRRLGSRAKIADETWAINALGDVFQCDRIFHLDDVRIQEIRAEARPESNIANMLTWLRTTNVPIYTSCAHPDYPGTVDFPLEDVVNHLGYGYFNSTAAYAVAYAIHIGVKRISIYGCDYTYANAHDAERGRGCVEFWLGFAAARGIKLRMPQNTSLMDACEPPDRRYYGYDCVEIKRDRDAEGVLRFSFLPRPLLPSADEIESSYDHSQHPNTLVSK